ncbi:acyltransferase family protein [candidate division KSB1 bacterium]
MQKERLLSLDAFRGMTIAGMLLVNNPGTWSSIFPPLRHAEWHGCTPTDLIFPFFLFIVGISMTFSFSKRKLEQNDKNKLLIHVIRRSIIIYLLGFILTFFYRWDLSTVRIPGVLQRISVCYLFASVIYLYLKPRGRIIAGISLLAVYWILVRLVPVPGFGAGDLSRDGNIIGYVDTLLLSGHLYMRNFDPEGIISTLPAIVTVLTGTFIGNWIRSGKDKIHISNGLFVSGTVMFLAGYVWSIWLPINKQLWTNSYVFYTAGIGTILLGLFYWLIDIKGIKKWSIPFVIFGTNAILAFFMSSFFSKTLYTTRITVSDGSETSLYGWIYNNIFKGIGSPEFSSLLFALTYVLFWVGIMYIFYKKRIFVKV